jgi:hypothetical protein
MSDKEPLKITWADLGEPEPPGEPDRPAESQAAPGQPKGKMRGGAEQVGQKVSEAVKGSTARVAHKIADTTAEATSRSAEAVRDKVTEAIQTQSKATADAVEARLREIDWKDEAQKGAQEGLRWLSQRLAALAEKMRESDSPPPAPPGEK